MFLTIDISSSLSNVFDLLFTIMSSLYNMLNNITIGSFSIPQLFFTAMFIGILLNILLASPGRGD